MKQNTLVEIIEEQTGRALWEVRNLIDCVPDQLWNKEYCEKAYLINLNREKGKE